jgi:pyruvate dehydrogenase E2 component (dihydrolipoamide acetyltransferase)
MGDLLAGLAPWPKVDFAAFGEVEVKPLSKIQSLTGAFLGRNWVAVPHVTHHDEADITDMDVARRAFNEKHGAKVTPVVLLMKVCAEALREFPKFNASLDVEAKALVLKKYAHIGVAVDTPMGLLVAVIRDADKKSLTELATELAAVAGKARTKGLSMAEMSGGCMSISSLGHIGGTGFTPIVNAPEVAILGVTRTQTRAAPGPDGGVLWRQMLPLSLSYDHRVVNGADAARFVRFVADRLASPDLFA